MYVHGQRYSKSVHSHLRNTGALIHMSKVHTMYPHNPMPTSAYAPSVELKRKVWREGMRGVETWEWKMIDPF